MICTTLALIALSVSGYTIAPIQANDLDPSHWAHSAVQSLKEKGLITGYTDGNYRGKRAVTRYELAAALNRMLRQGGYPATPSPARSK